jgi:predicted transcriptional regulator
MFMPKMQGISARETCPDDILVVLLNGEIGFETLVEKIGNNYSRATVSKYLTELYDEESFIKRRGRRGNYYLTEKGRKKAKTKRFVKQISKISDEFTEQFILNYKDYVMNRVKSSLFFPYNTRSIKNDKRPLLPPEYNKDWQTWQRIGMSRLTIRPYPEIEKLAQALETDLTKHGFTDEEILKLWIIGNGILMMKAVKAYGAPSFFAELPFKFPPIIISLKVKENDFEKVKKDIKEKLRTFNPDDIQKEMSVFDLFPS